MHGQDADYGQLHPDYGPYPRAVVWRVANSGWAGVSCDLDRVGNLTIADRVRFGPHPMSLPFRLAAVPEGLSLVQLIETTQGRRHTAAALFEMVGDGRRQTMEISNGSDPARDRADERVERRALAGRQVAIRRASQSICLTTRSRPICIFGPADEPASDWSDPAGEVALRTAELLTTVDDPDDETRWVDADQALPH